MPTAFDTLQRARFGGVPFRVTRMSVRGGLRHHEHERPKVAGAKLEKLGRKAYRVTFSAIFTDKDVLYGPRYWPENLAKLRALFELESTADLVIPTIGTIQACAVNWTSTMDAKMQNGETFEIEFVEDMPDADALLVATFLQTKAQLDDAGAAFKRETEAASATGLFDAVTNALGAVVAIRDTVDLWAGAIEAKAAHLARACQEAEETVGLLQRPGSHSLADALRDLWAAANAIVKDAHARGLELQHYAVPRTMSVSQISTAIYGDTSHAVDILQLNPIEDAFAVPAGFDVRYYPAAA